ncbi:MAG: 30S ribosomal protein S5 [Parcubacteria group bacterium]|nr:30S ribosomal protein S5 [Parcubacteria group bacterium]MBI2175571.1 30S ribosomal protein S5 [Parcubacteria group bacterium]
MAVQRTRRRSQGQRPASDVEQKIIDIRRVARVVAGGRRFSFRVALVAGNRKGEVGLGIGKAADTALAIEKAFRQARKRMVKFPLTPEGSVPVEISVKYGPAKVIIKPAAEGRGLAAGGPARTVLELGGVRNASAKIISRSKNKLNNAQAMLKALAFMQMLRIEQAHSVPAGGKKKKNNTAHRERLTEQSKEANGAA